jgi:hypothetical protein
VCIVSHSCLLSHGLLWPHAHVPGKTMSQTFHANSATRLHPSEWSTGVAAGGAAVFMLQHGITTTEEVYDKWMPELQAYLNSSTIGQPLEWTFPNPLPPLPIGFTCGFNTSDGAGTCVSVDTLPAGYVLHNSSTCDAACPALGSNVWLADATFWTLSDGVLNATQNTLLKKSTANSDVLPPEWLLPAPAGELCTLTSPHSWQGYFMCTPSA